MKGFLTADVTQRNVFVIKGQALGWQSVKQFLTSRREMSLSSRVKHLAGSPLNSFWRNAERCLCRHGSSTWLAVRWTVSDVTQRDNVFVIISPALGWQSVEQFSFLPDVTRRKQINVQSSGQAVETSSDGPFIGEDYNGSTYSNCIWVSIHSNSFGA